MYSVLLGSKSFHECLGLVFASRNFSWRKLSSPWKLCQEQSIFPDKPQGCCEAYPRLIARSQSRQDCDAFLFVRFLRFRAGVFCYFFKYVVNVTCDMSWYIVSAWKKKITKHLWQIIVFASPIYLSTKAKVVCVVL